MIPRVVRSHSTNELDEAAALLLRALGYNGYACIEFKRNPLNGLYTSLKHLTREKFSPSHWCRPYLNPYVFVVLSLRDPLPFLTRLTGLLRSRSS